MSSATDIRIAVSFKGHRKRRKLRMLLGAGSTDYLIDLWINTATNHPGGVLTGMSTLDVALEAGWEDDPEKFVSAMIESGFLDKGEDGNYRLHDWEDHQPFVIEAPKRSQQAKKAAESRWSKKAALPEASEMDAHSMLTECSQHCDQHADRNAPTYLPTYHPEEENTLSADAETTAEIQSGGKRVVLVKNGDKDTDKCRDGSPVAYAMTVQGGGQVRISEKQVAEWEKAFPSIPVKSELFRIQTWSQETSDSERWKKKEAFMATCNLLAKKNTAAMPLHQPKPTGRVPHYI